ncbi:MAG: NYN domain-containing protein [Solirubrobacterales bacterium]|nr:NYN domain-containing protein [Solirubrobacterales bacterium]
MERIFVDGMNVLGSRPDGWWRDRPAAMARLTNRLDAFAAATGADVLVVFDGRPHRRVESAAGSVTVGFAPGGPDAADRDIVARLREDPDPGSVVVATSDRRLRNSVKAAGAGSISAGELLRRLEAFERGD